MATSPQFISAPVIGFGSVTTAQTSRAASASLPTNGADLLTGGTSGTRILEVVIQATDNPADSIIVLWLYNGSNYVVFDEIDIGDPAAASATVSGYRTRKTYDNLVLPSNSWKLAATVTATTTAGAVNVFALGGNL